jgi:hypothetical protein
MTNCVSGLLAQPFKLNAVLRSVEVGAVKKEKQRFNRQVIGNMKGQTTMKKKNCYIRRMCKEKGGGIMSCLFIFTMLITLFTGAQARAAGLGIQWVGAGVPITDPAGAFGVPTANWLKLTTTSGTQTFSPASGGALTVTWITGGGQWTPGATFTGFTTAENQILSGCLFAMQNDTGCGGPITVTISGMNSVATGDYTLQLMASINGGGTGYTFQPATVNGTGTLNFNSPVAVAANGTSIASVTTNMTLSGDVITLTICNDEYPGILRAELSGIAIVYTPAPAPVITTQPLSQTIPESGNVTFTSAATGSPGPLTYQWQYNDTDIPGATNTSYSLTGVTDGNSGNYRVKVTDGNNLFSYSAEAALIVAPASPFVVYDPSTMIGYGNMGSYSPGIANYFSVVAGTSVSVNQLGFASPASSISGTVIVQLWDAAAVKVLGTVTFTASDTGSATGGGAYLYLKAQTNTITLGPGSYAIAQYGGTYCNVPLGETINTGNGAILNGTSRWNGGNGPGTLPGNIDGNAPHYLGPTLQASVSGAPAITQQPQGGASGPGNTVVLSVTAGGSLPLTYQWKKNNVNVGLNSPTLTLSNVTTNDSGSYWVVISNTRGTATSATATVNVAVPPTLAIQLNPGILISGTVGGHYQVQYSTSLNPTTWLLLQDIPSLPSSPYLIYDPTPTSAGQRFYRGILP